MEIMWIVLPIILVEEIFVILVQRIFVERTLNSRKRKTVCEAAAWSAYFIVFNGITYILTDNNLIYILTFCSSFFLLLLYLYRDRVSSLIYVTIFLYMIGLFSEILTYYIVLAANRLNGELMADYDYYVIIAVISKLVWFCLIKIVLLFVGRNKGKIIDFRDWLETCFVPVGSIFIIFTFLTNQDPYMSSNTPVKTEGWMGMAILLGINIVTSYLYEKAKKVTEKQMREKFLQEQCGYYMRQCEESKALWMELGRFRHDMKQKYIYFRALLQEERYEELERCCEEDLAFLTNGKAVASSGNIFFDSILNYKAEIARRDGIGFSLELEIPHDCRINGEELSICLGNLLDNAIEAARDTEEEKRRIYIRIRVRGGNLYLMIRNPYSGTRIKNGGEYMTTKSDNCSHGWGLRIVREIVERYHGEMEITDEREEFCVKILLYQIVS